MAGVQMPHVRTSGKELFLRFINIPKKNLPGVFTQNSKAGEVVTAIMAEH